MDEQVSALGWTASSGYTGSSSKFLEKPSCRLSSLKLHAAGCARSSRTMDYKAVFNTTTLIEDNRGYESELNTMIVFGRERFVHPVSRRVRSKNRTYFT
jgi:hypothetical protein